MVEMIPLKNCFNRSGPLWLILFLVLFCATAPSSNAVEPAKNKVSSSEGQAANKGSDAEITEEFQLTIDMIRQFWKRENRHDLEKLVIQPFTVPPRKDQIEYFPCQECHEEQETNPKERQLSQEHEDLVLDHGGERFWCLTCHMEKDRNFLTSLKGGKIDFDASHLLCGQCHFPRQKDWYMGAHGKRIGQWHGERLILLCVECHNPHSPSIKPRRADPPPEHIREIKDSTSDHAMEKYDKPHYFPKVWEKIIRRHKQEQSK